jgi:hypothetical protein
MPGAASLRRVRVDFDRVAVFGRVARQLGVVLKPSNRRGEQLAEPAREGGLGFDEVVGTALKVVAGKS